MSDALRVQRYRSDCEGGENWANGLMIEDPEGDWVKFEVYAQLRAELEAVTKDRE